MSRTVKLEIYSYEELSPEAQKVAREEWSETERENGDQGVCDWINDHFEYHVGEAGYPNKDIRWSLSYCQGDGMAFYGYVSVTSAMIDHWLEKTESKVVKAKADALKRLLEIEAIKLGL
ncbi:MAG: hypothetical protein ACWGQW_26525, partial [bacterium]